MFTMLVLDIHLAFLLTYAAVGAHLNFNRDRSPQALRWSLFALSIDSRQFAPTPAPQPSGADIVDCNIEPDRHMNDATLRTLNNPSACCEPS